jgi:hypothetical protein
VASAVSKSESTDNIRDDAGNVFLCDKDREAYITNFYSMLYRKDDGVGGSIEDFLGEHICQHPLVRNSKLNNLEKYSGG